jgi:hypothetical protein
MLMTEKLFHLISFYTLSLPRCNYIYVIVLYGTLDMVYTPQNDFQVDMKLFFGLLKTMNIPLILTLFVYLKSIHKKIFQGAQKG